MVDLRAGGDLLEDGIEMLSNRYFAALAFVGFLMAASAGGSSPAAAQGCGPWNNWCMPQCGDWNNWCAQECGPWNNWCLAQCGAWNNWCRGVCGPWNGFCAQEAYGPGPGWASDWRPYGGGPGLYRNGPGWDNSDRNYGRYDNNDDWDNDNGPHNGNDHHNNKGRHDGNNN